MIQIISCKLKGVYAFPPNPAGLFLREADVIVKDCADYEKYLYKNGSISYALNDLDGRLFCLASYRSKGMCRDNLFPLPCPHSSVGRAAHS